MDYHNVKVKIGILYCTHIYINKLSNPKHFYPDNEKEICYWFCVMQPSSRYDAKEPSV